MDPLISVSGITKHYETPGGVDVPVLHGIDLAIGRGEFVVVMGHSSASATVRTPSSAC
jgi:ABC-type lipoprotein export system ATPase subunit